MAAGAGAMGSGGGAEIADCRAVGEGAVAGWTTAAGVLGAEGPARPPRRPPVPGKLLKLPPPEPGALPNREL